MTGRSRPEEADSNFLSAGPPPVGYFAVAFPQPQFLKFRLYGQELAIVGAGIGFGLYATYKFLAHKKKGEQETRE